MHCLFDSIALVILIVLRGDFGSIVLRGDFGSIVLRGDV